MSAIMFNPHFSHFSIPLRFGNQAQGIKTHNHGLKFRHLCFEKITDYFHLYATDALLIENADFKEKIFTCRKIKLKAPSYLAVALKIISYSTLIIPLIAYIAKRLIENRYKIQLCEPPFSLSDPVQIEQVTRQSQSTKETTGETSFTPSPQLSKKQIRSLETLQFKIRAYQQKPHRLKELHSLLKKQLENNKQIGGCIQIFDNKFAWISLEKQVGGSEIKQLFIKSLDQISSYSHILAKAKFEWIHEEGLLKVTDVLITESDTAIGEERAQHLVSRKAIDISKQILGAATRYAIKEKPADFPSIKLEGSLARNLTVDGRLRVLEESLITEHLDDRNPYSPAKSLIISSSNFLERAKKQIYLPKQNQEPYGGET